MKSFMITLFTCSVTMSVLALVYVMVMSFMPRRYSVKGRYYAWLIIVIGLIFPFRPQWNHALIQIDIPAHNPVKMVGSLDGEKAAILPAGNESLMAGQSIISPDNPAQSRAVPIRLFWQAAALIWLAGMFTSLGYHGFIHYRFVSGTKRISEPVTNEQTIVLLENLKNEMGIEKKIGLYQCPYIGSPMLLGFLYPRILLPAADFGREKTSFILKHELVHFKRKDIIYKVLVLIAMAMHWFNPLVYLLAKIIDSLCEMSCDISVVQDADADMRQSYSETIIDIVKYQSKFNTILATNFYGGKKGMKKRITSIMDASKKRAGIAIFLAILALTAGTSYAFAANLVDGFSEAGENLAAEPTDSPDADEYFAAESETGYVISVEAEESAGTDEPAEANDPAGAVKPAEAAGTTEPAGAEIPAEMAENPDPEVMYQSDLVGHYVIEYPEKEMRFTIDHMDYRDAISGGDTELLPFHLSLNEAAKVAAAAILEAYDISIDGMSGRMSFWYNSADEPIWTVFIFDEERTAHSHINDLFYLLIDGNDGEILWIVMNTPESPFRG